MLIFGALDDKRAVQRRIWLPAERLLYYPWKTAKNFEKWVGEDEEEEEEEEETVGYFERHNFYCGGGQKISDSLQTVPKHFSGKDGLQAKQY